jgi:hypothetical protein
MDINYWRSKMDIKNGHYQHTLINTIFEHLQPMSIKQFQKWTLKMDIKMDANNVRI